MRTIIFGILLSLCAMSVPSYGDVQMVAKNIHTEDGEETAVANYDKKINQLDQASDELSASIFSRKDGVKNEGPSKDGMAVSLVKVRR